MQIKTVNVYAPTNRRSIYMYWINKWAILYHVYRENTVRLKYEMDWPVRNERNANDQCEMELIIVYKARPLYTCEICTLYIHKLGSLVI